MDKHSKMRVRIFVSLLILALTAQPTFASDTTSQSARTLDNQVSVSKLVPLEPKPACLRGWTGKKDCTARKAYKRIQNIPDSDVNSLVLEYEQFLAPLFAACYKPANVSKPFLWTSLFCEFHYKGMGG